MTLKIRTPRKETIPQYTVHDPSKSRAYSFDDALFVRIGVNKLDQRPSPPDHNSYLAMQDVSFEKLFTILN